MKLFLSDLDNTLIYSYKREIGPEKRLVETMDGKELSYMTASSHRLLQAVKEDYCFVPVTTRSLEQYHRIQFFEDWVPEYALTSNGGLLLRRGIMDRQWQRDSLNLCREAGEILEKADSLLTADPLVSQEVRLVDGFFLFTKSEDPTQTMKALGQALTLSWSSAEVESKVRIFNHGSKVYVVPETLSKGTAVKRLMAELRPDRVIAAGDSEFDVPMLLCAHEAWFPQELESAELSAHPGKRPSHKEKGIFSDLLLQGLMEGSNERQK